MAHERSYLAGMTDYTGVGLDNIHVHLREWMENTDKTINDLRRYRESAENQSSLLKNSKQIISYIDYFIDLFSRYRSDLERLVDETKESVSAAHVEIISQLYKSSTVEEQTTIQFRDDWVYRSLPHEEIRPLLDDVYRDTRDRLIDFRDLSNLAPRLKTFIRDSSPLSSEVLQDLHLKPNIFGIGININRIMGRLLGWFKKRKRL